jgi:hypothetical protein
MQSLGSGDGRSCGRCLWAVYTLLYVPALPRQRAPNMEWAYFIKGKTAVKKKIFLNRRLSITMSQEQSAPFTTIVNAIESSTIYFRLVNN